MKVFSVKNDGRALRQTKYFVVKMAIVKVSSVLPTHSVPNGDVTLVIDSPAGLLEALEPRVSGIPEDVARPVSRECKSSVRWPC